MKPEYFRCDCGCEVLCVDSEDVGETKVIYLSIFESFPKYSMLRRLRSMWRILWHGAPHTDQICLGVNEARRLFRHLAAIHDDSWLKQWKKNNKAVSKQWNDAVSLDAKLSGETP